MKSLRILLIIALTVLSANAFARGGFGGGRSSFSSSRSSYSGRSSFGGSRSSGSAATISRPSYSRPSTSGNSVTVVHTGGYGYGGGGSGFWTGMMMGNLMSRPAVYGADGVVLQPAVVGWSIGDIVFTVLFVLMLIFIGLAQVFP